MTHNCNSEYVKCSTELKRGEHHVIVDLHTLPFTTQNLQALTGSRLVAYALDGLCAPGSFSTFDLGAWLTENLASLQSECPIHLKSKSVCLERAWGTNLCFMLFWRRAAELGAIEELIRRPRLPFKPTRRFMPSSSRHDETSVFYTATAAWLLAIESTSYPQLRAAMTNSVQAAARKLASIGTAPHLAEGFSPRFAWNVPANTDESRWLVNIKSHCGWCLNGF